MGKPFILYKFRTMKNVYDNRRNFIPDKDRLTTFGSCLRKPSFDELPELFNILKGEMSLVEPRPLLMRYLERYTPKQMLRHEVKPGMTGWAQVNGRNVISWQKRFELDVRSVNHLTFRLDVRIVWLTLIKVIRRESINAGKDLTMPLFMVTMKRREKLMN